MRALLASVVLLALGATASGTGKTSARALTFGARSTVTPEVSSNWSGYAALSADPVAVVEFTDVTATWRQPKSTCTANRVSSAAFWVGLGGYDPASIALEQLGTGADCDGTAKAPTYYAWWELIPAASVRIPLKINPGDTISAAVFLRSGQTIVFSLKNLTRHTRFSKVLTTDQEVDSSSAEWIAEAPSDCSFAGRCLPVALTNFGSVTFSNIAAIGNAHPGTLTDPAWTSSAIELIADGSTDVFFGHGDVLGPGVGAVPGDPSSDGRAFSVGWQRNLTPP